MSAEPIPGLDAIINRSTEDDPRNRFPDLVEMMEALGGVSLGATDQGAVSSDIDPRTDDLFADLEGSLFWVDGDSQVDEALMESIHDDLESIDFHGDPKGEEKVDSIFGANPLSARRVESVKAELKRFGVASDAVSGSWLGYEPPQISEEIAQVYRLDGAFDDLERNQSVMLVAFR
jgi:hypothetical protein